MASGNWDTGASDGNVSSSANITDNRLIKGDGGAKGIQQSGITVDDSDNVTGVTSLTVDGSSGNTVAVNSTDLVVDSTNTSVGIGTSSPSGPAAGPNLNIYDSSTNGAGLRLERATTGSTVDIFAGSSDSFIGVTNGSAARPFSIKYYDGASAQTGVYIASDGDVTIGDSSATSSRKLNISESASTTATNLQITNGSSGKTGADGLLVGIDASATPNAEIVNFEASELRFKTNNLTAGGYDEAQNVMSYGNGTNGGSLDITNVTTGTGSSTTFDALRFLAANGSVITGPLSGHVYISMVDGADVKTIQYRYLNTGDGTTNQVANLGDQAQTGTNPWASTAVVADGSGVKVQLTTSAGRTSVTTICRFIGIRGVNA